MRILYLRVQPGEHLSSIADMFATTAEAILRDNALAVPGDIRPGMVLRIVEGKRPDGRRSPGEPGSGHGPGRHPAAVEGSAKEDRLLPPARGRPGAAARSPAAWGAPAQSAAAPPPPDPGRPGRAWPGVITCGAANRPAIALTFETSFGAGAVAAIVDSLRRHSAVATWFWSGEWAKRHPELARQIVRAGHQVELHGHTHQHLRELTPAEVRRDLERAGAAVRVFTGRKPRYLRPPFGSFNRAALATAAELGYRVALWSVDSLDWQNPGVGEIANRVMRGVRPGAIVLMHGTADQAPGALEEIIPGVRNAGYSLVTLDELLRDRLDPGPTP